MSKHLLYAMPLVTVVFVVFAIFVVGAPQSYLGARVRGGPTEGVQRVVWQVEVIEKLLEVEDAARLDELAVEAVLSDGRRARWSGAVDAQGTARVELEFSGAPIRGPLSVQITTPSVRRPLARGEVRLRRDEWLGETKQAGGWVDGKQTGELKVRVAVERGVLAVPFRDRLWIDVRDAAGPVEGAEIAFEPEGADLHLRGRIRTDSRGRATVAITPLTHAPAIKVDAKAEDGQKGGLYANLPVVPGALNARLDGSRVRIESPIERDAAWVAVISDSAREAGGRVALERDGRGGSVGHIDVPELSPGPLWAVVSSEADMNSMALVGWPLRVDARGEPPTTRAVRDRVLLDGLQGAYAADAARRLRARLVAGVFTVFAAALVGLLLFRRVRKAQVEIERHLREASDEPDDAEKVRPAGGLRLAAVGIALLCVMLGFAVVALIAIYKIG